MMCTWLSLYGVSEIQTILRAWVPENSRMYIWGSGFECSPCCRNIPKFEEVQSGVKNVVMNLEPLWEFHLTSRWAFNHQGLLEFKSEWQVKKNISFHDVHRSEFQWCARMVCREPWNLRPECMMFELWSWTAKEVCRNPEQASVAEVSNRWSL